LTVLWPFLRPQGRVADAIGRGGQLRHLLDLARSSPRRGSDVIIDPALIRQARAIARGAPTKAIPEKARDDAQDFAADLVRLANERACWSTRFDRPDPLARRAASSELRSLVDRATNRTLRAYGLSCPRIEWPASVGRTALAALAPDATIIVGSSAVPNWQTTSGNVLSSERRTLVVNDPLDAGLGHVRTPLPLRQRILSAATWSSTARSAGGRDATVIVVDPTWDPGSGGGSHLAVAMDNKYVEPVSLDRQIDDGGAAYTGTVGSNATAKTLSADQVAAAAEAAQLQRLLSKVLVEKSANLSHDQDIAAALSQRWLSRNRAGERYARDVNARLQEELGDISIEGPESLTLSSSKGRFPVTISNRTQHRVAVGTVISSTNPAVAITIPRSSVIAAGESRTLTASIDMDGQSATTVSIQLTTGQGTILGAPSVFNVRSSRVGAALWIAISVSIAFVAIALIRRFARPGHRPEPQTLSPDDPHD
jgi:hypothetical protein